jgi:hypothetical protein
VAICVLLVILDSVSALGKGSLSAFLGIDIVLYIFFWIGKELIKAWSRFGYNCSLSCLSYSSFLQV